MKIMAIEMLAVDMPNGFTYIGNRQKSNLNTYILANYVVINTKRLESIDSTKVSAEVNHCIYQKL